MDRINNYRKAIKKILTLYDERANSSSKKNMKPVLFLMKLMIIIFG